ncbi:MAG: HsdR family type I site-specific deoxyribonuclease [Thermoguttaceae bacterium]|nr:HsdR family type I site-specific deoxyribonuclease [Thermoguttaceae bacterium]
MPAIFSEAVLEQAILDKLIVEGYEHVSGDDLHRELTDVLIEEDLSAFLAAKYAPQGITASEISSIIRSLRYASALPVYSANRSMFLRMVEGETFVREDRGAKDFHLQLIDFDTDNNKNIVKIVNQMTVKGPKATRRPDAIVYINGLPVVVMEFKSAIKEDTTIHDAYVQITTRYMRDIPELFKYNCFAVLSDGVNTKAGSIFSDYEHFYSWRRIEASDRPADGIDALDTMVQGMFRKERLYDIIHNFIYFPDSDNGKNMKVVASYPQYFAARKLLANVLTHQKPLGDGKGGTYFGTTGCGKSIIMLFLTRLIMHEPSLHSPTVLLITDRSDLDDQLSRQFLNSRKFIGDNTVVEMDSREQLKDLLGKTASGGVYLTTIQKFADEFGELSTRQNIICISDEAHRTSNNLDMKLVLKSDEVLKRYGFAKFLHTALPQTTYIGFTGTPVDATMDVFGPVIDQYTMTDSVKDGITVRLVYDGRPARAVLDDSKVQEIEEYYKQCLAAGSNEYQVEASKKAVTNMVAIVGDDDVLNSVADYFIDHYETRVREGSTVAGKCMFVCLNRPIAFKFYNILKKKRPEWFELKVAPDGVELSEQDKKELIPMPMCQFVATRSKDDPQDMYDLLGTDAVRKTAAIQFKNIHSNFKIAIVVDLWLTGFDVPFLDTIYIDKPITQSHTIVQTVSRVNRSYAGKDSGLIVDFIGIKLGLLAALRMYTDFREDLFDEDSVQAAIRLVQNQLEVLDAMMHGFDNKKYFTGTPGEKLQCMNEAAEFIQKTKDLEQRFMSNVLRLSKAFNLCNSGKDFTKYELDLIHYYKAVRSILFKLTKGDAPDTDTMNAHVQKMLEDAIKSEGVEEVFSTDTYLDSEAVDLFSEEYLTRISRIKLPNTKVKILAQLLKKKVNEFKKVNKIKAVTFEERLQAVLDNYNSRMTDADYVKSILDDVSAQLIDLLQKLKEEQDSFSAMGIDYEEKAFYDILIAVAEKFQFEFPESENIELAKEIRAALRDKEKYADWANSAQIKALMQADIIIILAKHGYPPTPPEIYEKVYNDILEQAENFKKYSD